jgi:PKD repeat protein
MRGNLAVRVAVLALIVGAAAAPAAAADQRAPAEQFYVIGFRAAPRDLRTGDGLHGGTVKRVDRVLRFARVATRDAKELLARARADPGVRYVVPDPEIQLIEFTPNDPRFSEQYGLQHVRAPEAWDTTLGTLDAKVCILDTGVRYTHEDLAGVRWLGGTDIYNNDTDPWDDNGHGTHVAGIAAASIDNAKGIAGVANVGIWGVKVLSSGGTGSWSQIASGIRWCSDNGGPRTVISMSLAGGGGSPVLQDAVQYAYGRGNLLAGAAGNGGPCSNCVLYPAKYPEVMAITCTNSAKTQCGFSSDGPESELAAPGESILSTYYTSDTSYVSMSGTSMSTPHVSGVAALVWSHANELTNTELRQLLVGNAQDLGSAGWDELYGYGMVDAKETLDAASSPPIPEAQVLFEDFDGGPGGFALSDQWHVSGACATPPSTPNYLGYNQDATCTYQTGSRAQGTATVGADLTGKTAATLNLSHRYQKETYWGGAYDVLKVQVSRDGGATWTTLWQRDSRDPNQATWTTLSLDLDAYTGGAIKVRFSFDSIDQFYNSYLGWLIDNVEVTAGPAGNVAPVADAGPPQTVADGDGSGDQPVNLNGTGSSDSDGAIESYEWREGGSLIGTGSTPTVNFAVGNHTVTLTVTDDDGATDSDDVVVTVNPNQLPTASFTYATSGLTLDVDGSGSSDFDGTITSYSWDWGDSTPVGSGATASHAYAASGTYTVALTVTDNGGAAGSSSRFVTVSTSITILSENFDDGTADGWTLTGLWHLSGACSTPPSTPNSLNYNQGSGCTYFTGSRTSGMATVDLDLTGRSGATLDLTHRFVKELYSAGAYDVMRIQASTDGGAIWTTLRQWDSRNPNQPAWTPHAVDLTLYAGRAIKLRFFFDSIDQNYNNYAGWFIDDVLVTAS